MSAMLAPLLMLALSSSPAPIPDYERASYLYSACQAAVRFQDAGSSGTPSQAMESNRCISYLNGYIDAMVFAGSNMFCVDGASMGTLARVYVTYMTAHPKLMDEEIALSVSQALVDAYPCSVTKK